MGVNYEPRNLKVKYETKNAFITMGTQREAEEFSLKMQELTNSNKLQEIYFSLYKSKVDRISSNSNFRRFNDMPMHMKNNQMGMNMNNMNSNYKSYNGKLKINKIFCTYLLIFLLIYLDMNNFNQQNVPQMQNQNKYKSYNQDFMGINNINNNNPNFAAQQQQPQHQKNPNFNSNKMNYNDFDGNNNMNMMQQQHQNNYNNFNQQQQQMMQMNQNNPMNNNNNNKNPIRPDVLSREDMGDFIYNYCENLYKE